VADFVLSAEDVGRIVQYVAPGFFARLSYQARFPREESSTVNLLLWSIAASLPLVALGQLMADALGIAKDPVSWDYLAVLLLPASLSGYSIAALRDTNRVRRWLGRLGLRHQPHGSLYAMTMLDAPAGAGVLVEFEDRRRLWRWPAAGPSSSEDGIEELVITCPAWWSTENNDWTADGVGEAVVVRLDHVRTITLSWDPFKEPSKPQRPGRSRAST
jgi:hypothetical protein